MCPDSALARAPAPRALKFEPPREAARDGGVVLATTGDDRFERRR